LLDEFKTNKTGRKYELREILGHVYEFSLDQHGSRFIQQARGGGLKLECVNNEDVDAAFGEVVPRILHLMTDVFGNYVVQKFLEHGTPQHRACISKALHGHVLQLSLQMYGCRVVQKALEVFTEDQQVDLVSELDGHVMRCVRDQNGNHVIQKCIECVPTHRIAGLLDNFLMCVVPLSTHPFGCRIIQRILEHVRDQRRRAAVMADILGAAVQLTQDQYGNYVIQHVLERGTPEEKSSIIGSLSATVVQLSMHKFASNVIEKCLIHGSTADRDLIINRMLGPLNISPKRGPWTAMIKDQFGNYVVQKVLEVCTDVQREAMLARVRAQLHALKRFTYGKHIVARVEK
ncbi:pumilio family protein, partial [Volvox carteri f. nagariensis]